MKSQYVVNAFLRLPIQRLDVAKGMAELQSGYANFVRGQAIKHESVVGVGAVRHEISRTGEDTVLIR